jgi:hypothetical protein
MKPKFIYDKKILIKSDIFQNDTVTKGVNELNKYLGELGYKCEGVNIVREREKNINSSIINLNGYLVEYKTLKALIDTEIILIEFK